MDVLALIPARGGSKAVPRKNIADLGGRPLIAWTIQAALAARLVKRVVVSTDDHEIRNVSVRYGAEVPFLRPKALASDTASAIAVVEHTLKHFETHEGWTPDAVAFLQPTSPFRVSGGLDDAIQKLRYYEADTIVSVVQVPHNMLPESLMKRVEVDKETFTIEGKNKFRRQDKRNDLYARNGPSFLIVSSESIRKYGLYGPVIIGAIQDKISSIDIDDEQDLEIARIIVPAYLKDYGTHPSSTSEGQFSSYVKLRFMT